MAVFDAEQARQNLQRLREILSGPGEAKTRLLLVRQFLEGIYRKLSEESKTSFGGLFARMQYVHNQLDPPPELVSQVNQLRILCNKVAHEEGFELSDQDWLSGVHALRELLNWLHPGLSDPELDAYLSSKGARPFPTFKSGRKQSFVCVALSWKLLEREGKESGIEISASLEDGTDCTIWLNNLDDAGRRWSTLSKVLWQYCTLNCLNLSEVSGREGCFQSNPLTLIVVEPDFLIDASALADCFSPRGPRPEYFILNRLASEPASDKQIQGTLVNNILDELISAPDAEYKQLFRKGMAQMPISVVALGKQSALNIHRAIQSSHLPRIKEFTQARVNDPVQLEPSYINPNYGLQGRLDILYGHGGKQYIVELKSGSPPHHEIWKSNQMQVVAYNMIIRDCYPHSALGTSSILYSAAEENSLRHVVNTVQLEQELLLCRNRIVGIMRGLALDPSQFFGWLLTSEQPRDTGFMQAKRENIVSTLKSLEEHEYEWFLEQLRLLAREIWFEKTGGLGRDSIYGHNALWQESARAKRDRYKILDSLKLESVDFNLARFQLGASELITDFRAGDVVVLYRQKIPVSRQEILRGQIARIDGNSVEVLIRGGLRRISAQLQSELWALEHDILESSLYSPLSSIFSFLQASAKQRQLWLGLRQPESNSIDESSGTALDQVIQRMFASREYHIVQGPPGTGKTSGLLTTYVKKLYQDTDKNVLILSFTNRAVDEICLNLRRHEIPFIRTGRSEEIGLELMENLIQGKKFDEMEAVLKSCRIWVATVQSCNAWLNDLLKIVRIDELVIDEASQIVENSILGIIPKAGKTILIGDQNQLPPISRQSDQGFEFKHEKLAGLCYGSYSQSLMERLFKVCKSNSWLDSSTMLHQHYRMHDAISGLIQHYYQDRLVSMEPRQKEPLPATEDPLLSSRLVWIDCPPSRFAYYDPLQVRIIRKILDLFAANGTVTNFETDIGIVAPFRAMIHALLKELTPEQAKTTIDTVERFQGSERRNIIITLPLHASSALRNIEALSGDQSVDRKLNVAVSRAQERLIILGNAELCRNSGHYKLLMDKIAAAGKLINHEDILKEIQ
ncbi:MAG: ATP-dependent helicase [Candidatus Syntrophosphaera sp.]|nr:ATP-dependent helicase [Candidatus Syntrophosphaera sp.]